MLTGCGWPTTTDDRSDADVLATLLHCADRHGLAEVSPMVCNMDRPRQAGVPAAAWPQVASVASASCAPTATGDLLPGIASLFNGALFRASTIESVGVPDLRLFIRGDETEMHRRLVRSGLPFGTCLNAVYLHPCGD